MYVSVVQALDPALQAKVSEVCVSVVQALDPVLQAKFLKSVFQLCRL